MTRHNALIFYGMAAASFLETAIPLHAGVRLDHFAADAEAQRWIERQWCPVKRVHAHETRSYVEAIWPEFDWSAAYTEFYEIYQPGATAGPHGLAREALARSAGAAQAAAFYRCLGTAADDAELRRTLYRMSADESAHFHFFRDLFSRHRLKERVGPLATYRIIVGCARRARDVDVQHAFGRLGPSHWYGTAPFPQLDYGEFLFRMGQLVRRHLAPNPAQRLLFRPWWQPRALQPIASPSVLRGTCSTNRCGDSGNRPAVRPVAGARL